MEKKEEIVETPPPGGRLFCLEGKQWGVEFDMEVFEADLRDTLCHYCALEKLVDSAGSDVYDAFGKIYYEYNKLGIDNNNLNSDCLGYDGELPIHIPRDRFQPVYSYPYLPEKLKRLVAKHGKALDRYYLASKEMLGVKKSITSAIKARCVRPISHWYIEEQDIDQQKVIAIFK
jgi:hypothetical protein